MLTAPHLLLLGLSSASAGDVRTWPGWDELPAATRQLSNPDCRVALVIGNATYPHATDVDNAARDARAVAELLRDSLGFTVDSDLNLGRQAQRDLVQRFLGRVQPGCVALVYYAGHAVQGGGGANYLLPVDMGKDDDPALQAVSLQYLLAQLKERKAVVRLAFLDACRTLVYDGERGSRSTDLAPVQGAGLFVGYAASPGKVADDGPDGGHSPFTAAFLAQAARPGVRVEQIFDGIQDAVSPTGQEPHGSDFLAGDFYFLPPAPPPVAPSLAAAWRAVLALPEAQRRDAVLAFAHQHAQSGAPEVAAAITWLMEHPGGGEKVVTIQAPVVVVPSPTATAARSTGRPPGERMVSSSGIALRWVPATGPGGFTMGSDPKESGHQSDEGPAQVVLTEGRWVMESEVTQAMFSRHLKDPSAFNGDLRPVEQVTWCEAVAFADKLSVSEGLTPVYGVAADFATRECTSDLADSVKLRSGANGYRLLTEAEWEWAARAGQSTRYAGGDELNAVAVHSRSSTDTVCSKQANAWSLCDMTGNVWEWVQDGYASTLPGGTDPLVRTGSSRVFRGGSWLNSESNLRVASRDWISPGYRWDIVGFRLSRSE